MVVWPGHTFLCQMTYLLSYLHNDSHPIHLVLLQFSGLSFLSATCQVSSSHPSSALSSAFHSNLEACCLLFMYQVLAASMHGTYSCAQKKFVNFCVMTGHLSLYGSPCPASEWTLWLLATYLADSQRHSSIKVFLSVVRSLDVNQGFPESCPLLHRAVRGIKHSQGALLSKPRLPVSSNILCIIYSALDLNSFDDVMFWAACLLAYFAFLRSAKFTVSSLSAFNPSLHLSMSDVSVDVLLDPSCLQVFIKAFKTDPFQKGCNVFIGLGSLPLCTVQAVVSYLGHRGHHPRPLFLLENGRLLTRSLVTNRLRAILLSVIFPVTVSNLGQPLPQRGLVFQIT